MATVHIRRMDEDVVTRLKARAAENNRSLEAEARDILERAVDDDTLSKLRSFREIAVELRRQTGDRRQTASQFLVRRDRETGHGPA